MIEAWYFSEESRRLRFGDDREIALGVTHCVKPPIELCERGLHAAVRALDALQYAPGPIVWRVQLDGDILTDDDKLCATKRTYVAGGVDATDVLRAFARQCALNVMHLWNAPAVVRQYLETGDESIKDAAWDAATAAATAAARAAAWDAAWAAATAAAWAAATAAARAAAWDAARDAATAAARAAAWDAAWDAQHVNLETAMIKLIQGKS